MPQPLTPAESAIVHQLFARAGMARDMLSGDPIDWDTPVPQAPLDQPLPQLLRCCHPGALAGAGAHHLVLAALDREAQSTVDEHLATQLAISALLWDELDLAREWAQRAFAALEARFARAEPSPSWWAPEYAILKLAKLCRRLGLADREAALRARLQALLPALTTGRDQGMEALRWAVELGYEAEAEQLLLKLAPLTVGHSRGRLTLRLFRTLLERQQYVLAYSLLSIAPEAHDADSLRRAAISAACEVGSFELALLYAVHRVSTAPTDWPLVFEVADFLLSAGRLADWRTVWTMMTEEAHALKHHFPAVTRLQFLARLVEHAPPADRVAMYKHAHAIYQQHLGIPNAVLFEQLVGYHLVIAAWGASKPTVRKFIQTAKLPRYHVESMIRAAAARGLPGLLDLIPEAQSRFLIRDQLVPLRYAHALSRNGRRNRFKRELKSTLARAVAHHDQPLIHAIRRFVGTTVGDLDLYRTLTLQHPSPIGITLVDLWPLIKPYEQAGDLAGLQAELSRFSSAHCLSESGESILNCLQARFGLAKQLQDF